MKHGHTRSFFRSKLLKKRLPVKEKEAASLSKTSNLGGGERSDQIDLNKVDANNFKKRITPAAFGEGKGPGLPSLKPNRNFMPSVVL